VQNMIKSSLGSLGKTGQRFAEKNAKMLVQKITDSAGIGVPAPDPARSGPSFLTMEKCEGESVKKIVESLTQVLDTIGGRGIESLPIGSFFRATKSFTTVHMLLDFIGWNLLCDESEIIHADPHPGNFILDFEVTCKFEDDGPDETIGNDEEDNEGAQQILQDIDLDVVIGSFDLKKNFLHVIDWGSSITNDSLHAAGMFLQPGSAASVGGLHSLRKIMRSLVKALLDDDDDLVKQAALDLGLTEEFVPLFKQLLAGNEKDIASRLATAAANQSKEETVEWLEKQIKKVEDLDINGELAKLANVLLFAGGLALSVDKAIKDRVTNPDKSFTVVNVWQHWLNGSQASSVH